MVAISEEAALKLFCPFVSSVITPGQPFRYYCAGKSCRAWVEDKHDPTKGGCVLIEGKKLD